MPTHDVTCHTSHGVTIARGGAGGPTVRERARRGPQAKDLDRNGPQICSISGKLQMSREWLRDNRGVPNTSCIGTRATGPENTAISAQNVLMERGKDLLVNISWNNDAVLTTRVG